MATLLRRLILQMLGWLLRLRRVPIPDGPPQRILVIKPDQLGDVLLLLPALQVLRNHFPNAHITVFVGPWAAPIVQHCALVDRVQICPFPGFTRQPKPSPWQPYSLLLRTALLLRRATYDAVLLARDDHWWGALLAALAAIPQRIGFATPTVAPFLTTALPHDLQSHVAAQNLALVHQLIALHSQPGSTNTAPTPPPTTMLTPALFPFPQHALALPSRSTVPVTWPVAKDADTAPALIALQPGAGGSGKLWLPERWAAVGRALEDQGYQVVVTGGPSEATLVQRIAAGLRRPQVVTDASTILHLGVLFQQCRLVLGVDSGPLHLAVALGVPTIALFGPADPQRFAPWGNPDRHRVLRSGLWCSPCGVLNQCPRGTLPAECMTLIPTRAVLAACAQLLNPST